MTAREESQLKMFQATNLVLTRNESLWKNIQFLAEVRQKFTAYLETIEKISPEQEKSQQGQTKAKRQLKEELAQIGAQLSAALQSYATATKNPTLLKQAAYTQASLLHKSEISLYNTALLIYSLTQGIEKQLEEFFVTSKVLETMQSTTEAYKEAIPSLRADMVSGRTSRENLSDQIQQTNSLLRDTLDKLMLPFATQHPDFYKDYKAARKVLANKNGKKPTPTTKLIQTP